MKEHRPPVRADALIEVSRDIRPKARARRYPREQRRRRACRTAPPSWRPRAHQLDVRVIGLDRTDVRAEPSEVQIERDTTCSSSLPVDGGGEPYRSPT